MAFALISPVAVLGERKHSLLEDLSQALNSSNPARLGNLFIGDQASQVKVQYRNFLARFSDLKWSVTTSTPLKNGRQVFDVFVTGTRNHGGQNYSLESHQKLLMHAEGSHIIDSEVITEHSILKSKDSLLTVQLQVPDVVLTGSTYDFDVLLDNPLGGSMVAGGLVELKQFEREVHLMEDIDLGPLGGGGIYKLVQAPLAPGSQIWGALIVHPDGLISITKRVRVVEDKAYLSF